MADLNPMVPGDVPYPQYSVTTTMEIDSVVPTTIVKGQLYTTNTPGNIVDVASDFRNGFFQAKETPEFATVVGDTVQVLGPRTRMIFTTQITGLAVGEDVIYLAGSTNVISGVKTDVLYVGKIFEIYTRNLDSTRKKITEVGDRIVVETVQA